MLVGTVVAARPTADGSLGHRPLEIVGMNGSFPALSDIAELLLRHALRP